MHDSRAAITGHADDRDVLEVALEWLREGRRVALVMVLRTWGSSPRPPGSMLAMSDAGRFVGSVSGGCVEETLVMRYRAGEVAGPEPTLVDFGVERAEATRLGLPCGGRLELLVEELSSTRPIETLIARLDRGERVARRICLHTGEVSLHAAQGNVELLVDDDRVVKTFGPSWQLLLVGDGQLARHLAGMALQLDYRVTICDPREAFTDPRPLDGVRYSRRMPDDEVQALRNQARCAILTLAHDPRQDDLALSAALESAAFYIGALGSTRSAAARRARLESLGFDPEQIARIHGPAGLPIGSKRPAEIALSMLAEVTAVRNGVASSTGTAATST
ncbi:MAG: XdhC family protein [Chromatiaceae bacterium]|nr:XdhC family protein [Gammaproteobacteria bacterium]MCP5303907.1 XdhC family protein [Chromatiaceae bacterium]MCP5313634.1 XdhC family protein [Chromatiaceae bacterium]